MTRSCWTRLWTIAYSHLGLLPLPICTCVFGMFHSLSGLRRVQSFLSCRLGPTVALHVFGEGPVDSVPRIGLGLTLTYNLYAASACLPVELRYLMIILMEPKFAEYFDASYMYRPMGEIEISEGRKWDHSRVL